MKVIYLNKEVLMLFISVPYLMRCCCDLLIIVWLSRVASVLH